MDKEIIEYKGYKIRVERDDCPINPFEEWDCEPPFLTYYGGSMHGYAKSYSGAPETIGEVMNLLPDCAFARGARVKLIKSLDVTMREFAEERNGCYAIRTIAADILNERLGERPSGWRSAKEWFDAVSELLTVNGIQCYSGQSNGYCQGDTSLVLVIATPEWIKESGISEEHIASALEGTFKLYGYWAWGDVYGIAKIIDPEGNEMDDGSVWGFFGSNHEDSGLLEAARGTIEYHMKQIYETELNEPACLI